MADISAKAVNELRKATGVGMMDCKKALIEANGDIDNATEILRKNGLAKAAKKGDRETNEGLIAVVSNSNSVVLVKVNSETDFVSRNENFSNLVSQLATHGLENKFSNTEEFNALPIESFGSVSDLVMNKIQVVGENIQVGSIEKINLSSNQNVGIYIHGSKGNGIGSAGCAVIIEGGNSEIAKTVAMHIVAMRPRFITIDSVDNDIVEKEKKFAEEKFREMGKPEQVIPKIVEGSIRSFYTANVLTEQELVSSDASKKLTVSQYLKENGATLVDYRLVSCK